MPDYTRVITIGGIDFSSQVDGCKFSWALHGGCDRASLSIPGAVFDNLLGIAQDDEVIIKRSSGEAYWKGIVVDLETQFPDGLNIECVGKKTLLAEVVPTGLFGTDVETAAPSGVTVTEAAKDSGSEGLDSAKDYVFCVTTVDEAGETFAGAYSSGGSSFTGTTYTALPYYKFTPSGADKKVTLAWTAVTNATGYRVYIAPETNPHTVADATFTGMERFDVVGTEFTFQEDVEGESCDFPFAEDGDKTSLIPTIDDTEIEDVVNHLLDTYLPDGVSKGTVDIGALNVDVDFLDYRESGSDLQKVLDGLVALAGDVHWYVDEIGQCHFRGIATTTQRTFEVSVSGSIQSTDTNLLVGVTRRLTRDGVTHVKVESEPEFEEAEHNCRIGVTWDRTTVPSAYGARTVHLSVDPRFHTLTYDPETAVSIPEGAGLTFITDYNTLQEWLDVFPNHRWLWIMAEAGKITEAQAQDMLSKMRTKLGLEEGSTATYNAARPKVAVKRFPGLITAKSAGLAAQHWLLRRTPTPERWVGVVENVNELWRPGRGNMVINTDSGSSFTLELRSVDYEFGDIIKASLTMGDEEYDQQEEAEDVLSALVAHSLRKSNKTRWRT